HGQEGLLPAAADPDRHRPVRCGRFRSCVRSAPRDDAVLRHSPYLECCLVALPASAGRHHLARCGAMAFGLEREVPGCKAYTPLPHADLAVRDADRLSKQLAGGKVAL